jgi:hypothetical protein
MQFDKIIDTCLQLSEGYGDTVFIGGVAVYLHMSERTLRSVRLEASHDADFMISFAGYGQMKDEVEITFNPRLGKHQMVLDGVEFDMYVERLHRLVVPYDEAYAQSAMVGPIHVACLEHLLVLKLEAFESRGHSSKGDKDSRDLVKIGLLLGDRMRKDLVQPYIRKELVAHLRDIAKSAIFFELCEHNAHEAKRARISFTSFMRDVARLI